MPIQLALPPNLITDNMLNSMPLGLMKAIQYNKVTPVLLTGRNPAAGTTLADLWGFPATAAGASQYVRANPTTGYALVVCSDSTADASAGTGAQQVAISYLDTAYLPHTAVFALNGQTMVSAASMLDGVTGSFTITNCLRNNGAEVVAVGSGGAAAGNIYIGASQTFTLGVPQSPALIYDCILAGDNNDSTAMFTVPAGMFGMIIQLLPAINDVTATAKFGKIRLTTTTGSNGVALKFDLGGVSSNNNPDTISLGLLPIIQPMSDLDIQAITSATTEVGCANMLILWPSVVTY